MSSVFLSVLDMSLHGSVVVLALLALRLLFRRAPKGIMATSWVIAAFRLMCPFVLTSAFSLMPVVREQGAGGKQPSLIILEEAIGLPTVPEAGQASPWLTVIAAVWCVGVVAMLIYTCAAYHRTQQTLREAVQLREGVYECDRIPTPFIFGLLHPRIYLPSSMQERDRGYVIAHERAHLARWDHVWKPLGFAVLAVHWFNPLIWVAYVLFCRDMEMACDERVLCALGADSKKPYADALINCAAPTRRIAACPLAFGETDVKARVHMVLRYQKSAWWISTAAVGACLLIAMCLLTDPKVQALAEIPPAPPQTTASSVSSSTDTPPTMPTMVSYTQAMSIDAIGPRVAKIGETVTVRVAVEDSRGVKDAVDVLLFCEKEDGAFITVGDAVRLTLVQGTATNGVYEGVVVIPEDTAPGEYRLRASYIPVSHKPAVCTAYTPEGEAAVTVMN